MIRQYREVLMKINGGDIVIHGIGDAMVMAKRETSESEMRNLEQEQAVSRSFWLLF